MDVYRIHAQINLLTAVMNDAPVLPDEDDEVGNQEENYEEILRRYKTC